MEFGYILPVVSNGAFISKAAPRWEPEWETNLEMSQKAEKYGFKYGLSQVTLRGFGGETGMWNGSFESLTLSAAILARTEELKIFGSTPILAINPAMAARMSITLDDISHGRFGLNIVTGWNDAQYSQMGVWPGPEWYSERYKGAAEYVEICKELWETGVSDFKGKWYSVDDCRLGPLPRYGLDIVCAGQSENGIEFAAEYGDWAFLHGEGGVEGLRASLQDLDEKASRRDRKVGGLTVINAIIRDTDEEAQARVKELEDEADLEAIAVMTGAASQDTGSTGQRLSGENEKFRSLVFFNQEVAAGSPETLAAYFDELAKVKELDGCLLVFEDLKHGLDRIANEVAPLMKEPTAVKKLAEQRAASKQPQAV